MTDLPPHQISQQQVRIDSHGGADTELPDLRRVTCNVKVRTRAVSQGAKAYLLQIAGGDGRRVLVRNFQGRWVEAWLPIAKLENFRITTVTPQQRIYDRLVEYGLESEIRMQRLCDVANGIEGIIHD